MPPAVPQMGGGGSLLGLGSLPLLSGGFARGVFGVSCLGLGSSERPRWADCDAPEGWAGTADPPLPPQDKNRKLRPLYDIPYMFEAREFLRKKLIGKKVSCARPAWGGGCGEPCGAAIFLPPFPLGRTAVSVLRPPPPKLEQGEVTSACVQGPGSAAWAGGGGRGMAFRGASAPSL